MEENERTIIELDTTLVSVRWRAPESAFIVGTFISESVDDAFVATGDLVAPTLGDSYSLSGSWEVHPKYGKQFRFESYSIIYPATKEGIERYLASGLIKGIGKTFARRIVKKFKEKTIDVLNDDIDRLREIEGIGEKKLERIKASWEEQRGVYNVMVFLKSFNVSTAYAVRIYREYGAHAIEVVKTNPYRLIDDVDGIGFVIADRIARQMGIGENDTRRLAAGIRYLLNEASRASGHVYLPRDEIVQAATSMLGADENAVTQALAHGIEAAMVIEDRDRIFAQELYFSEESIAHSLDRLFHAQRDAVDGRDFLSIIARVEEEYSRSFSPQQADAIQRAVSEPATIVTGGPGTGKSTTVIGIIAVAEHLQWKVALCAPTGRAAKRLYEVTRREAKTIHRLLEYDPFAGVFQRGDGNELEIDLLIVDEVSMVDTLLMAYLLRAVPDGCRVVFVGDSDQLPSVGPGNVLADMIASTCIHLVTLTTIFRQAEESAIVANSHRVRRGERLTFERDCFFVDVDDANAIPHAIIELVSARLPRQYPIDPMRDVQLLSPMHNTPAGVRNLNAVLQQTLNPHGEIFHRKGDRVFRVGDKVMQTKNNYEKEVFNGDIGFVRSVDAEESTCVIQFDERTIEFSFDDLDDVVLAYCKTIHKSQGSEYRFVLIPMTLQHRIMLQRNLIYTAMTRAKEMLIFVGQRGALSLAIKNDRITRRYTTLRERLVEKLK